MPEHIADMATPGDVAWVEAQAAASAPAQPDRRVIKLEPDPPRQMPVVVAINAWLISLTAWLFYGLTFMDGSLGDGFAAAMLYTAIGCMVFALIYPAVRRRFSR